MLNTIYKVGDVVCVRTDLNTSDKYPMLGRIGDRGVNATSDMTMFRGKFVTIREVVVNQTGRERYKIVEDPFDWAWTDSMFTSYEDDSEIPDIGTEFEEFLAGFLAR